MASRIQTRPKPSRETLRQVLNGDERGSGLVQAVHHGLCETPLNGLYPWLDLSETVAFAAASWQARREDRKRFDGFGPADIYAVFNEMMGPGFRQLNAHKKMDERTARRYGMLNPHRGRGLKARLGMADEEDVKRLLEGLNGPVRRYLSPAGYEAYTAMRLDDNDLLAVADLRTGNLIDDVRDMLSPYPRDYVLSEGAYQRQAHARGGQLPLF